MMQHPAELRRRADPPPPVRPRLVPDFATPPRSHQRRVRPALYAACAHAASEGATAGFGAAWSCGSVARGRSGCGRTATYPAEARLTAADIEAINDFAFSTPGFAPDMRTSRRPSTREPLPEGRAAARRGGCTISPRLPAIQRLIADGPYCQIAQEYLGCRPTLGAHHAVSRCALRGQLRRLQLSL